MKKERKERKRESVDVRNEREKMKEEERGENVREVYVEENIIESVRKRKKDRERRYERVERENGRKI